MNVDERVMKKLLEDLELKRLYKELNRKYKEIDKKMKGLKVGSVIYAEPLDFEDGIHEYIVVAIIDKKEGKVKVKEKGDLCSFTDHIEHFEINKDCFRIWRD